MENKGEFSSFDELLEELNKIKNTKDVENIEEIIQKAHRIKNTTQELKKENERLSNRFGLVWKNIPEKFVKYVSDTEIVYDKKLYEYICDRKNSNEKSQTLVQFELENEVVKAKKEATSFSFSFKGVDYLTYSNKIYKFKKNVKEDYVPYFKKKGGYFEFGDDKKDLIIEGDNYFALQTLLYTHKNKVDVIYIDPPYNTGNKDFKYNDSFFKDEDGDKHSAWLSFMEKRLKITKNILSENGFLVISIDENEQSRLQMLVEKIFGEKNLIGCLPTIMNMKGNQDQFGFAGTHEFTFFVAKDIKKCTVNKLPIKDKEEIKEWKRDEMGYYKKGRGLLSTGHNNSREDRPYMYFPVLIKNSSISMIEDYEYKKIYNKKENFFDDFFIEEMRVKYEKLGYYFLLPLSQSGEKLRWDWGFNGKFKKEIGDILINKNKSGSYTLNKKQRSEFNEMPKTKPKSLLYRPEYSSGNGTNDLKVLFGKRIEITPKPIELIKDLIILSSKKESLIIDFFAGSGTTGQAVWELNKEDGGNRNFILCTNNENNICEDITFERLKRANEKYGYNKSLEYLKLQHASISQIKNADKNKNFEYLKELINLKYNSFKAIIDNDNFYVNEKIAVLKEESKMEEFFETYKEHKNFAFLSPYKTGGNEKFKKLAKDIAYAKEENIILLSDNYIEEIKEIIKEEE